MFGRRQFENELALVAAKVALTNEIIVVQGRRITRVGAATQLTRKIFSKRCWRCVLITRIAATSDPAEALGRSQNKA